MRYYKSLRYYLIAILIILVMGIPSWYYFEFCNKIESLANAVLIFTATSFGVLLAFTLNKYQELKTLKRRWKLALILIFQDYEQNRNPLNNIKLNLESILNSNIPAFQKLVKYYSEKPQNDITQKEQNQHIDKIMSLITGKLNFAHLYTNYFVEYGYESFLNTDALMGTSSDDIFNYIHIAYKELNLFRQRILYLHAQVELIKIPPLGIEEKIKEIKKLVNNTIKQIKFCYYYNNKLTDLIKKELVKHKGDLTFEKREIKDTEL